MIVSETTIVSYTRIHKMDNKVHKEQLQSSLFDMLTIDSLSLLPKNKLLLYQRYVLSKLFWHLTVANLAKTWVIKKYQADSKSSTPTAYRKAMVTTNISRLHYLFSFEPLYEIAKLFVVFCSEQATLEHF